VTAGVWPNVIPFSSSFNYSLHVGPIVATVGVSFSTPAGFNTAYLCQAPYDRLTLLVCTGQSLGDHCGILRSKV